MDKLPDEPAPWQVIVIGATVFAAGMVLAKLLSHRSPRREEEGILPTPQTPPDM
jgi:hypothetical protein